MVYLTIASNFLGFPTFQVVGAEYPILSVTYTTATNIHTTATVTCPTLKKSLAILGEREGNNRFLSLKIEFAALNESDISSLMFFLKENDTLKTLEFHRSSLRQKYNKWGALWKFIAKLSKLETLKIRACPEAFFQSSVLLKILRSKNSGLKYLDLSSSRLSAYDKMLLELHFPLFIRLHSLSLAGINVKSETIDNIIANIVFNSYASSKCIARRKRVAPLSNNFLIIVEKCRIREKDLLFTPPDKVRCRKNTAGYLRAIEIQKSSAGY